MLNIVGGTFQNCDRIGRREVLQVGALTVAGATLPDLLRRKALGKEQSRDTAVIQIFMGGGPSHIDMYDLKPDAPAEIRGEFHEIPTNVPGTRISEHLPLQAKVMDKVSVVRSVMHTNSAHLPSSHLILTGYEPGAPPKDNLNPFTGAVVSRVRGPNVRGMPAYVAVPRRVSYGGSAYLGPAHRPFTTQKNPNDDDFHVPNLSPLPDISVRRLGDRQGLLRQFDRMRRDLDLRGDMAGMDRYYRDALELITSDRATEAFDINREDPKTRERYGRTYIGQNCLLARRLVEAGVTYVSCLSGGGWDTHTENFSRLKGGTLQRYDRAIAALVSDIHERGLADRVLVLAFGEFGRTPRINRDAGRDHWPGAMSVLFSGGGLKMGQMIGTTDSRAAYPTSTPYSSRSVLATMYHKMGVDYGELLHDQDDRPMPILPEGRPIPELL